jgi:hypothetical protein
MRSVYMTIIPLCAGVLLAQEQTRTQTTTTWNGVLVDAACQTTRTDRQESVHDPDSRRTTKTESSHIETRCPATQATNSFGVVTADGRFVRFDNPSNTRVVEIVRGNRALADRTPLSVKVLGTANGDVAVVESLTPQVTVVETTSRPEDMMFDVRHKGDHGKLIVTSRGLEYEGISDAKRSRSWTYSQIKELKRDGDDIKIEPYSGDSYEFEMKGKAMSKEIYQTIADRIVAARTR